MSCGPGPGHTAILKCVRGGRLVELLAYVYIQAETGTEVNGSRSKNESWEASCQHYKGSGFKLCGNVFDGRSCLS